MLQNEYFNRVSESVSFLKTWHPHCPEIAIVLGSGLSDSILNIDSMKSVSYKNIPGFKAASVAGHPGDLKVGTIKATLPNGETKEREILFLRGRNHCYEGHNAAEVVHNIRSVISWGVKGIILTSASGCLDPSWSLGKMMLFTDHINATSLSPLSGEYGNAFGTRFVDMTTCYDLNWQEHFHEVAKMQNLTLYSGTFYGVLGPQYETPAEIKMMQLLGAKAVSMSSVLEVIAARQMGAKIAALSCLTNYAAGLLNTATLDHSHVTQMGSRFFNDMNNIILKTAVSLTI